MRKCIYCERPATRRCSVIWTVVNGEQTVDESGCQTLVCDSEACASQHRYGKNSPGNHGRHWVPIVSDRQPQPIRIEAEGRAGGGRVFIGGNEVKNLRYITLTLGVHGLPRLILEILCLDGLTVEGESTVETLQYKPEPPE